MASFVNHYNAVLFAYGASRDRKLGIPGERNLKGIYSARDFVGWYNGLPEHADLSPDLEAGEEAVVIGQGNVALDVARTLLTDLNSLRQTDMTEYALATLSKSRVKRVRVVGRRGPMQVGGSDTYFLSTLTHSLQASFTIKEVRELLSLPHVAFDPIDAALFPPDVSKLSRTSKRFTKLLLQGAQASLSSAKKSWSLDFLLSPTSFKSSNASSDNLSSITFKKNELEGPDIYDATCKVSPTQQETSIDSSLAFRSIGYKSEAIDGMEDLGIHFETGLGIILGDYHGRVCLPSNGEPDSVALPGLYCSGWVKRGPAGVIANTMEDAFATAETIASDWGSQKQFMNGDQGWDALKWEADQRGLRSVNWREWQKIDAAEKERGRAKGKPREKFSSVQEMLNVLI